MKRWCVQVCLCSMIVALALAGGAHAAGTDPDKAAASRELSAVASTGTATGGQDSSYTCPVGASSGGGLPSQALMPNLAQIKAQLARRMVTTKNLPPGNYRERCFGCLIKPDEDNNRTLNCVCPTATKVERIFVNLDRCKESEQVSYCSGTLVCGKCLMSEAPKAAANNASGGHLSPDAIMQMIGKGAQP